MTLPLWAVIGLTFLATLGIYKTVQVWRRDMELLGRMAEMGRIADERDALLIENVELEFKLMELEGEGE